MKRFPRSLGFEKYSGVYLWALFILVFSVLSPDLFASMVTVH